MKATASIGASFRTEIRVGEDPTHLVLADEPAESGGTDAGPTAMGLLAAALGACTAATLRSYANLKKLPLEGVEVEVDVSRRKPSEVPAGGRSTLIVKRIKLKGNLTPEQQTRMLEIAEKCPVNRALKEGADFS